MFDYSHFAKTHLSLKIEPSDTEYQKLAEFYAAPDRFYHTQAHVDLCLRALKDHQALAQRRDEIAIALWFHDAVYDTHRDDNELKSAQWAARYLRQQGASEVVEKRVYNLIMATKSHTPSTPDEALMCDIDLGILGADRDSFQRYNQAIRKEYAWVDEPAYKKGRRAVLRSFLDRKFIYHTETFQNLYEASARKNIENAVRLLRAQSEF